jgi:surface antigen
LTDDLSFARLSLLVFLVLLPLAPGSAKHPRGPAPPPSRHASPLGTFADADRYRAIAFDALVGELAAARADDAAAHAALDATRAELADTRAQRDALAANVAVGGSGGGPVPAVPATAVNRFVPGQCTWYVATRRLVTWLGDAWQWWGNARGIRPLGQVPRIGAIAVYGFSYGAFGHVAYVEAVLGDGSYVVSEMNYVATGYVDQRRVFLGRELGFIY